jgi:hypothetical protein
MSIRAWFSDVLTSSPQGISWKDKIVVGAPLRLKVRCRPLAGPSETGLVFYSEQYELLSGCTASFYEELLPNCACLRLAWIARSLSNSIRSKVGE